MVQLCACSYSNDLRTLVRRRRRFCSVAGGALSHRLPLGRVAEPGAEVPVGHNRPGDMPRPSWEQRSQLADWTCLGFRDAVAPPRPTPDRAGKLGEQAYRTLLNGSASSSERRCSTAATALDDPPAQAAFSCANQLVLVCDDEPDTASIVAGRWLALANPPAPHTGSVVSLK
jgi:hypothetical protein